MKAAIYDVPGGPDVLRYADVPDPVCGDDEVIVQVEAISIEGGDLHHRSQTPPATPGHVHGYAASGAIMEVGRAVRGRQVGQRVTTVGLAGSHAELRATPAILTWLVPAGLDMAAAAAVPIPFGTAYHCLFTRGALRAGETLLVQGGAGMVGLGAIQYAARAGARVLATVSGHDRANRLKALGLDEAIDHRSEDVSAELRRLTQGRGVDLVVDPVGGTLDQSIAALRDRGRLVFVGGADNTGLLPNLLPAMLANLTLHGVYFGSRWEEPEVSATVDLILDDVASGRIEASIDRVFPLSEAAAAHRYAAEGRGLGRTILRPRAA